VRRQGGGGGERRRLGLDVQRDSPPWVRHGRTPPGGRWISGGELAGGGGDGGEGGRSAAAAKGSSPRMQLGGPGKRLAVGPKARNGLLSSFLKKRMNQRWRTCWCPLVLGWTAQMRTVISKQTNTAVVCFATSFRSSRYFFHSVLTDPAIDHETDSSNFSSAYPLPPLPPPQFPRKTPPGASRSPVATTNGATRHGVPSSHPHATPPVAS
jgi:hypothetical protein